MCQVLQCAKIRTVTAPNVHVWKISALLENVLLENLAVKGKGQLSIFISKIHILPFLLTTKSPILCRIGLLTGGVYNS